MTSRLIDFPALGILLLSECLFSDGPQQPYIIDDDLSDLGRPRRGQAGWGTVGARSWGRTYEFTARTPPTNTSQVALLEFSSFSGGLLGQLRTDIRYPLIRSLKFTIDNFGCADFQMILNNLPDFPIISGSKFSIRLNDDPNVVYQGYLEYDAEEGTKKAEYIYDGFGFRKQLKDWVVMPEDTSSVYPAGLRAGEIVADIMENIVAPNTNVGYNVNKIDLTAGALTTNEIDFGGFAISDVFDNLALISNCEWRVDGSGELSFEPIGDTIRKTWVIGYGMGEFDVKKNISTVRNSIIVERTEGRGSGGSGFTVAGIFQDQTSIAKYGLRTFTQKVPGFFGNTECAIIGNQVLENLKEPELSASMRRIQIRSSSDILPFGRHRFIMPVEVYPELLTEDEDSTDWSISGTGDLALSNDTDFVIQGFQSLKLDFASANGQEFTLPVSAKGKVVSFDIWIWSSATGTIFTFGFGLTNFTENTTLVTLPGAGRWYRWRWDVESQLQQRIGEIGFRIEVPDGTGSETIYIDSITANLRGQRHYQMKFNRCTYTFSDQTQTADAEFGELPPKDSDYVAGLIAQTQIMNVGNRKR
jgi:hypothetical protein